MITSEPIKTLDKMVNVGPCKLHFTVLQGSDDTIVLEVGGGADSSHWGPFPLQVAQETGATVITYDRAGFGKSDLPDTPNDLVEEAGWLLKGLRELGRDKELILAGHSYGGWLIRLFASLYPNKIRGLVMIDPFSTEFVNLLGVDYLDHHPMAAKDPPFDTSNPEALTKNQRGLIRMVKGGLGPKVQVMQDIKIPKKILVRIITAGQPWWHTPEEDQAWKKAHEQMTLVIPGAKLIVAEESDHLIPEKQPELIIQSLQEVLALTKGT